MTGYTVLYRFDPRLEKPLQIDSRTPDFSKFTEFLLNEARYFNLPKVLGQEEADKLFEKARKDAEKRYNRLLFKKRVQDEETSE